MNRMLIAGNWKMNMDVNESVALAGAIVNGIRDIASIKSEVLLCPPYTSLYSVSQIIYGASIFLGAQNCFYQDKGAFTGEISTAMLKSIGCAFIIIGHSERRQYFKEDDVLINKKVIAVLKAELKPVLCIGETLDERQSNKTYEILERQINLCMENINQDRIDNLILAYEPVWAIGTGIAATTEQIAEAHNWLRDFLTNKFGSPARDIVILYGGSLNAGNADEIFSLENVNGGLIGGASLNAESFLSIIRSSEKSIIR